MKATTNATGHADCGCGCGGKKAKKGQSGAVTCEKCATTPVYQRPNFFDGQLLTEDDLQSLVQYTVDKNRLHNRHLWGDGVVCGLDAAIDPCNPAGIVVQPGYALDCCGNDLLLACPATLDITAMIRELRQRTGVDCGPDCPPPPKPVTTTPVTPATPTVAGVPAAVPAINALGKMPAGSDPDATKKPTYKFLLYLRYCETPSEPVSPYSTGASCADAGCQPTRVREGVRLEIACCEPEPERDDLFTRYCKCLADRENAPQWEGQGRLVEFANKTAAKIDALERGDVNYRFEQLEKAVTAARPFAVGNAAKKWKDSQAEGVEASTELLAQYARFLALDEAARRAELAGAHGKTIGEAKQLIDTLSKALPKPAADVESIDAAERTGLKEQLAAWGKYDDKNPPKPESSRLMAAGILPSDALWAPTARVLDAQRSDLLKAVEMDPNATPPLLAARLRTTPLPNPQAASAIPAEPKIATVEAIKTMSSTILFQGRARYMLLAQCLCRNLNPPCAPCDDPRVLIASFGWEDCAVVDLCILVRKFVLTPNSLRYWLPIISTIGQAFERLCCEDGRCAPEDMKVRGLSALDLAGLEAALYYVYMAYGNCRTRKYPNPLAGAIDCGAYGGPMMMQMFEAGPTVSFDFARNILNSVSENLRA